MLVKGDMRLQSIGHTMQLASSPGGLTMVANLPDMMPCLRLPTVTKISPEQDIDSQHVGHLSKINFP